MLSCLILHKKHIAVAFIAIASIIALSVGILPAGGHAEAEQVQPVKTLFTKRELYDIVYSSAEKYGANANQMYHTVLCEARKREVDGVIMYDATAQSDYYWKGVREDSHGLAMWNLPSGNKNFDGTDVTLEQATNPTYSLDLMAKYFSENKQTLWSCYRDLYT